MSKSIKPAPESEPFNKYAWAPDRPNVAIPLNEPNNEIEQRAFKELMTHFSNQRPISNEIAGILQQLLRSGTYSDIIRAPETDKIYRAMFVSEELLLSLSPELTKERLKDSNWQKFGEITLTKKSVFKPKNACSSWSESWNGASRFFSSTLRGLEFKIMLEANTQDNKDKLLACDDALYDLYDDTEGTTIGKIMSAEHEVIAIGEILVSKIEFKPA